RASGIALDIGPGVHRLSNVSALGTGHSRGIRISDGANVSADRLKVQRFATCIDVNVGADPQLDLKNGAVFDCTERAMELQYATGLIEFTTVARSGANSGPGPRAVECTGQMTFRSSIIWAPGSERAAIAGCTLASTIAGPTAVPGASNADPLLTPDLRLGVGSPARDATQSGPPHDADANPRPIGAGYDLGAYETP
ncbi:MAG TPA: choice-of-anchor Q domain-containing protein, partial [Kofleriaceae bacterium]|nr:choice-of-anchor Q domain-containing protein [Kofleriaceae bacterium]